MPISRKLTYTIILHTVLYKPTGTHVDVVQPWRLVELLVPKPDLAVGTCQEVTPYQSEYPSSPHSCLLTCNKVYRESVLNSRKIVSDSSRFVSSNCLFYLRFHICVSLAPVSFRQFCIKSSNRFTCSFKVVRPLLMVAFTLFTSSTTYGPTHWVPSFFGLPLRTLSSNSSTLSPTLNITSPVPSS